MPSATENNGHPPGMDQAHLLVPWYVAGKLEEAEAREIEKRANEDQEFAKLIAEAKREAQATEAVNEALGAPSPAVWARIEKTVDRESKAQTSVTLPGRIQALKAAFSDFFAGLSAPQWQALAVAAIAICAIEAGAIAYLAGSANTQSKFHTASGPQAQTNARQSVFIVSFRDNATIAEINKALGDAGAFIAEGPNADGLYRLGLRNDNVKAKDQAYAKLQASGLVKLILPEK